MLNLKRSVFYVLTLIVLLVPGISEASSHEQNVTVTLNVGDTILRVRGRTFPGAFVTIQDGGVTIGTTTANSGGSFDKSFPAQSPGLHTLKIFAQDLSSGTRTDTITQTVSLQPKAKTTVSFFLPTTLFFANDQVAQGYDVVIAGRTIPNGNVTVRLDEKFNYTAKSDGNGNWSLAIGTADFVVGVHSVYAVANDSNGNQSSATTSRNFSVLPAGTNVPETPVTNRPDTDKEPGNDNEDDTEDEGEGDGGFSDFYKPLQPVNEDGLNPSGIAFILAIIIFTLAGLIIYRPRFIKGWINKLKR